ncbi:hypothetical protein IRB79_27815 (plasmid) [Cytobacillus oceanisediminis]|nr:hypothetical protein IRB79_27815 [Cytobacillus oceanisediminis]
MKVDWRLTADGDLELGSPSYNEFDQLVYVDSAGEISTESTEGELVRDIPLAVSYMSEKQVIMNRLRTDNPDWQQHDEIGADLSELIGLQNTRETGQLGVQLIEKCLTYDDFIKPEDLFIRPVPISPGEILFYITINRPAAEMTIAVVMDLEHGLLTEYEVNK